MVTATFNPSQSACYGVSEKRVVFLGRQKTALIIPTVREAGNIFRLLNRVRAVLDPAGFDYEILIVDDDSRDGIEELVAEIRREDPRVHLLVRKGKRGLSGAILYGWMNTDASIVG